MSDLKEKIIVEIDADLEDLIPKFLQDREDDVKAMEQALEQSDFETIRLAGHGMKGSGSGYGFDRISEIGTAIEKAAKINDVETISKKIAELSDYLERVEIEYVEE